MEGTCPLNRRPGRMRTWASRGVRSRFSKLGAAGELRSPPRAALSGAARREGAGDHCPVLGGEAPHHLRRRGGIGLPSPSFRDKLILQVFPQVNWGACGLWAYDLTAWRPAVQA